MTTFDYWVWPDFFSNKEVKQLNNIVKKYKNKDLVLEKAEEAKKTSTVYQVQYNYIKNNLEKLIDNVHFINERHFGYNLFEIQNPMLNYNIYNKNSEYEWHRDGSNVHTFDIKLTLLINISVNKYEGGDFSFFNSAHKQTINDFSKSGDAIIFKSHCLHKISPVVEGKRESLTMFLTGPKFV